MDAASIVSPPTHRPVRPVFADLGSAFSADVRPTPLPSPRLVHRNAALADALGFADDPTGRAALTALCAGDGLPDDWRPVASGYAGHQFGVFVPQLGDGRALILGTIEATDGTPHELQLKGGGPTPWSRMGDGRAVLRSTIREYIGSEAMHALGIPTTRALALVASPQPVLRERPEPAAALLRTAPTHVRFGHLEWCAVRHDVAAMTTLLAHLADFLPAIEGPTVAERAVACLHDVAVRTAQLVAGWQSVGFVHTVMNTDNMSMLGLTIDYGPYAFMEAYDPAFTPNHSDPWGRYAYGAQPSIARWNVERLADALALVAPRDALARATAAFDEAWAEAWDVRFHAKLGFVQRTAGTRLCVRSFLQLLADQRADFTRAFRALATVTADDDAPARAARDEFPHPDAFDRWCLGYRALLRRDGRDDATRAAAMRAVNPRLVPRTGALQRAIERAEAGDDREVARLVAAYAAPFDERDDDADLTLASPEGGSALSCSS